MFAVLIGSSFDYLNLIQFNKQLFVYYCHIGLCLFKQIGFAGTDFIVLFCNRNLAAI